MKKESEKSSATSSAAPSANTKYKKLFSNTLLLGIGTFASKLLVFFLLPLYTGILTSAEYGIADILAQTANLLIPLASVGIYNGVFRFAADRSEDKKTIFSSGFFTLLIGLVGFCILSVVFNLIPYFDGYVWLIVLYVISAGIHYVCSYYLRAIDKAGLFALQGIFNTMLTIALNILFLVVLDMTVVGFVLSVVLANFVTTLFIFLISGIWRDLSLSAVSRTKIGELLRYSIPLIPTTVFWWITDVSDRYLVTYFCGDAVNGLYSASYKIPTILTLISGIFIEAWQFSAIDENKDENELSSFYGKVFDAFMGVVFVSCAGLILFSKVSARILFSDSFYGAWKYIPTLLLATAFSALVSFFGTVYMVKKKSLLSFWTSIVGAVINIALNIPLIQKFGPLGAAFATFICYFVVFLIRTVNSLKYIKFKLPIVRLTLSSISLFAAAAIMTFELRGWVIYVSLLALLVAALNIIPILKMCRVFLAGGRKRK